MAKRFHLRKRTIFDTGDVLYYSGFCLTDNKNFCEFFVRKFPKLNHTFKNFIFSEKDLTFSLDKEAIPVIQRDYIVFDIGRIDIIYYNHFINKFPNLKFFTLKEFCGKSSLGKILVFDMDKEKSVGLFNLDPLMDD